MNQHLDNLYIVLSLGLGVNVQYSSAIQWAERAVECGDGHRVRPTLAHLGRGRG